MLHLRIGDRQLEEVLPSVVVLRMQVKGFFSWLVLRTMRLWQTLNEGAVWMWQMLTRLTSAATDQVRHWPAL